MDLTYTKKELSKLGWATIGGRIEDYQDVFYKNDRFGYTHGYVAAYKSIKKTYQDLTDDVYRGLLVYMNWGTDAYYEIIPLEKAH